MMEKKVTTDKAATDALVAMQEGIIVEEGLAKETNCTKIRKGKWPEDATRFFLVLIQRPPLLQV